MTTIDARKLSELVVVTGAGGFIGARVVNAALEAGFKHVRCFVRPTSRLDRLQGVVDLNAARERVEIVTGDLMSRRECDRATSDASVVYHLAAGFDKSFAGAFMSSAIGTRNLIEAYLQNGMPGRFVNVSSFAVYSNLRLSRYAPVDESTPLEDAPAIRNDAYGFAKLKQEEIVRDYGRRKGLDYVILRPGTVFGPGKREISGRVGFNTFGFFVRVGGCNPLPMTYVDNCAEAIVLAGAVEGIDGEVFNVVDDEVLTSGQFFRMYRKRVRSGFAVWLPYSIAYAFCVGWEWYSRKSMGQLPPVFNRRRCAADWKPQVFPNQKIKAGLGWEPRIGVNEGMLRFLEQFPQ